MLLRPDLYENWYRNTTRAGVQNWKTFFSDPENVRMWAESFSRKPNKLEIKLEKMLTDNNLPYKYVGGGEVVIGYWNPDFINTDGKKKLIELFGDYFHQGENPQNRIDKFARYGFETLIIWGCELKEPELVLEKVRQFTETKSVTIKDETL